MIKKMIIKWLRIDKKLDIDKRNIYIYDITQRLDKIEEILEDNNITLNNK